MTSWENNLYEKKVTAADKKKAGDKVIADLRKEKKDKKTSDKKEKSDYTDYLKQQLEFKKQKYEDQKKRQIEKLKGKGKEDVEKSKEKAMQSLRNVKMQRISSTDKGATAMQKAGENLASLAGGVAGATFHGARALMKKRKLDKQKKETEAKQADKKEPGTPGRPKTDKVDTSSKEKETSREPQKKKEIKLKTLKKGIEPKKLKKGIEPKKLMPSSDSEKKTEPTPKKSVSSLVSKKPKKDRPVDQTIKKVNVSVIDKSKAKLSGTPERKKLDPAGPPKLPPAGPKRLPPAGGTTSSSEESLGQKARKDKKMKEKLIKDRRTPMESYSNWREEFLHEVEDKLEKEKVIDIMKGKNKVIINPPIGEEHYLGSILEQKLSLYEYGPGGDQTKTKRQREIEARRGKDTGWTARIGKAIKDFIDPPRSKSADPVVRAGGSYTGRGGAPVMPRNPGRKVGGGNAGASTDSGGTAGATSPSPAPTRPAATRPAATRPAPTRPAAPKVTARQQADAKTRATYDKLRKTDPKLAAKYGMAASRARFGNQLKPKTPNPLMKGLKRPAPGSVPKPPAPQVKRPAPGSVSPQSGSTRNIRQHVEYPEISNLLSEIKGGLWEGKKSEMPCNKPKAQAHGSGETGKSHVVKACEDGKEKLIRFGQLGVKGSPKKEGESNEYASRRKRFKTRHAKNIAKGKMSAAYWANKVKW